MYLGKWDGFGVNKRPGIIFQSQYNYCPLSCFSFSCQLFGVLDDFLLPCTYLQVCLFPFPALLPDEALAVANCTVNTDCNSHCPVQGHGSCSSNECFCHQHCGHHGHHHCAILSCEDGGYASCDSSTGHCTCDCKLNTHIKTWSCIGKQLWPIRLTFH